MTDILETLKEHWKLAQAGRGAIIHMKGAIGSGKSSILNQFIENVRKADDQAVVVSTDCGDHALVRSSDHGELEDLVARIAEGVRVIDADTPTEQENARQNAVQWLLPGVDFLTAATRLAALPSSDDVESGPSRANIHSDLLLDIARDHSVLLVIGDVHRTDQASKNLVDAIVESLNERPSSQLLIVLTTTDLIQANPPVRHAWLPKAHLELTYEGIERDEIRTLVNHRLAADGDSDSKITESILESAGRNPLLAHALVGAAQRFLPNFDETLSTANADAIAQSGDWQGLISICQGQWPTLRSEVWADLRSAAVVGDRVTVQLLAQLWSVPDEAAIIRVDAMCGTGLIVAQGDEFAFLSGELAAQIADQVPIEMRRELHAQIAVILRSQVRRKQSSIGSTSSVLDVTETWRETFRRDRNIRDELDGLWASARHFAVAQRHEMAAEAAVTLVERLFETSGGHPYLAGRFGHRADRERRHRIYGALTEASAQLELAEQNQVDEFIDEELVAIRIRLLTVRSRFKEVMGDFTEAARNADMARQLAQYYSDATTKLKAFRAQLEVRYASGDINAARDGLARLLKILPTASRPDAVPIYVWLAEAVGRWEWPGLHGRLFPHLLEQVIALGAHREAIKICMEWLGSTIQTSDAATVERLVGQTIKQAEQMGELPYFSEELARCAADMIQGRVDAHFDILSGEFYVPDLFGEGNGPIAPPLPITLERPSNLMDFAEEIALQSENRLAQLRVATTKLGTIYEARERLRELLDRWTPIHKDAEPVRLVEVSDLLNAGFMSVQEVERLTENIMVLSNDLGLDQCLADTVYEALDRELPGAMDRADTLFGIARDRYEKLGDAYGLMTLDLVEIRHCMHRGHEPSPIIERSLAILNESSQQLSLEQTAYIHIQFGQMLFNQDNENPRAVSHLEQALRLCDRLGDVDNLHVVAELLREIYRNKGDLARYRSIRERFRALDRPVPGIDPLGLELRIEQLLSLARQEADDEKAIEMVERCVQLFGRMPDGTTRIDECFVEISKICRRRADEAESEQGFQGWLQRSLEAVQIAASINRSLGNYFRVFEEIHELFDDLLGLGLFEEYVRIRAENRDLAFAVGNIGELLYLFEEHLQYSNELSTSVIREAEVRGFYEALLRYLIGMGAAEDALSIQSAFISFLVATGQNELADFYREPVVPIDGLDRTEADDPTERGL